MKARLAMPLLGLPVGVGVAIAVAVHTSQRPVVASRGASSAAGGPHLEPLLPPASAMSADDEGLLMTQLRSIEDSDPERALEMARDGNRRYPASGAAAERAEIVVKSLARQGKLSEARGEAEEMVNRYAGTPWAVEVEMHTGAHPHVDRVRP